MVVAELFLKKVAQELCQTVRFPGLTPVCAGGCPHFGPEKEGLTGRVDDWGRTLTGRGCSSAEGCFVSSLDWLSRGCPRLWALSASGLYMGSCRLVESCEKAINYEKGCPSGMASATIGPNRAWLCSLNELSHQAAVGKSQTFVWTQATRFCCWMMIRICWRCTRRS
jgi:hypothetical protein